MYDVSGTHQRLWAPQETGKLITLKLVSELLSVISLNTSAIGSCLSGQTHSTPAGPLLVFVEAKGGGSSV